MTLDEQIADIDRLRRRLYIAGLQKSIIVLGTLGKTMEDYQSKQECDTLIESIEWAIKQLMSERYDEGSWTFNSNHACCC